MASVNISVDSAGGNTNKISVTQKSVKTNVSVSKPVVGKPDKHQMVEQVSPSDTWVITHSLNKKPAVSVVNSAGTVIYPDITYNSDSQITLTFSGATSGKVYLN